MRRLWLLALAGVVAGCATTGLKGDNDRGGKRDPIPLEAAAAPPIAAALGGPVNAIGLTNSHKATGDLALYHTSPAALTSGRRYPLRIDVNRGLILGEGTATIGTVSLAAGGGVVDTELPAAAALADNAANPTTPMVGANLSAWDGATWDRVTNGSGVLASALRVTIATDDPVNDALAVVGSGAATAATLRVTQSTDDAAVVALQIMDDWDETNRAAVNPIAGQVGIAGGTGVDGATVPRVSLATNVGLPAGANNIGDVDVLTVPALIAGTATIGSVGAIVNALPAGTNNIGDVDILTINGQAPAFGTGVVGATVQRVTVATDDVVSVDWNGTAPPIGAGAEAAALRVAIATDSTIALEAGANNIGDVDVLTINGQAPAFGAGVVGATVQRVTVATDDVVSVDWNGTAPPIGAGVEAAALRVAIATDSTIALEAGAANIGDVDVLTVNGVAPAFGAGVVGATVQRVTVSTDDVVSVDWNGTAPPIGGGVQATALRTTTATDSPGVVAPDAAFPANTMAIAGRASTAKPAAMSGDADAVGIWTSRVGSIRTLSGEVALVTSSTLGADLAIVAANTGNRLVLVTVRERSGAAATLVVRHGTLDSDIQIVPVSLAANGVAVYQFPGGVNCQNGVFLDWLSGSVEVTVGTEDHE